MAFHFAGRLICGGGRVITRTRTMSINWMYLNGFIFADWEIVSLPFTCEILLMFLLSPISLYISFYTAMKARTVPRTSLECEQSRKEASLDTCELRFSIILYFCWLLQWLRMYSMCSILHCLIVIVRYLVWWTIEKMRFSLMIWLECHWKRNRSMGCERRYRRTNYVANRIVLGNWNNTNRSDENFNWKYHFRLSIRKTVQFISGCLWHSTSTFYS